MYLNNLSKLTKTYGKTILRIVHVAIRNQLIQQN